MNLRSRAFESLLVATALAVSPLHADELRLPTDGSTVVGWQDEVEAAQADTLADIAREFDLGHQAIRLANPGVDFWLPGEGTRVTIPGRFVLPDTEHQGIVLNVPEMRLYFYPSAKIGTDAERVVVTYPVSIGRMDWTTPLGLTRITAKVRDPSWTPPESIRREAEARGEPLPRFIPPGPDNPLGRFALKLTLPGYLIHGTNKPYGVGMRVTHGCVRLYPEDIARLFSAVTVGTPVLIVDQPVKVGWLGDTLFMEVHPPLEESEAVDEYLRRTAMRLIGAAASARSVDLSGRDILAALQQRNGMPVAISRGSEK